MTPYQQRWMLAVALKRPYPSPYETGAQESGGGSGFAYVATFVVGALVGGFVGNFLGEEKGFELGKIYAGDRAKWRKKMRELGIDPDAPHMRGIKD